MFNPGFRYYELAEFRIENVEIASLTRIGAETTRLLATDEIATAWKVLGD